MLKLYFRCYRMSSDVTYRQEDTVYFFLFFVCISKNLKDIIYMDIINIDAELFEKLLSKFENVAGRMGYLCRLHADKEIGEWLDNQDVCQLLSISKRTLQTLRDSGELGFTKIKRKVYYKPEDVEMIISLVEELRKSAARKGKQI